MNELPEDMERALAELEARAARAAARVDAGRVASRVLERLRTDPVVVGPPVRWRRVLRVAAAVAVLATGAVLVRVMTDAGPAASVATLPLDLADSLSTLQAVTLMDAMAVGADSGEVTAVAVTVDDLNEAELRALLRAMQSDLEGAL